MDDNDSLRNEGFLQSWLDQEFSRVLSEEQLRPDPALVAEGWERRFIADAQRTKEAIEIYEKLGFEVRAEPVTPLELGDECEECSVVAGLRFRTIYTRKRKPE